MVYQLLLQNIMKNTQGNRQQGSDSPRKTSKSNSVFIPLAS